MHFSRALSLSLSLSFSLSISLYLSHSLSVLPFPLPLHIDACSLRWLIALRVLVPAIYVLAKFAGLADSIKATPRIGT